MIYEAITWIIFSIFIVWLSAVKTKHFMKDRRFKNYFKKLQTLKDVPSVGKTIEEQKEYLRKKTEGGNDIIQVVISAIMFLGAFVFLIYNRIPTFYTGLLTTLIFSLILAWVFSRLQFSGIIYEFKFIDSFIGYWYASTFLVYIKFLDNMFSILLLAISIAVMVIVNKRINRWVGNE